MHFRASLVEGGGRALEERMQAEDKVVIRHNPFGSREARGPGYRNVSPGGAP